MDSGQLQLLVVTPGTQLKTVLAARYPSWDACRSSSGMRPRMMFKWRLFQKLLAGHHE